MQRVALIEFASVDRFHRATWMPFVRGMLEAAGVEATWVRFGLRAAEARACPDGSITLAEEDVASVCEHVRRFRPTHVLFNQQPSAGLFHRLQGEGTWETAVVSTRVRGSAAVRHVNEQEVAAFLNLSTHAPGANLFDDVEPSFRWTAGNRAASHAPPLPFLICGEECTFRAPLGRNPFFEGVALSPPMRRYGCAFCVRPAGRARWKNDPVTLFRRQLRALRDTHPSWVGQLQVRAVGEPVMRRVEAICNTLLEVDVPPIALLVDSRVDTLLEQRPALERALHRLADSPHALHMSLVGIESFVDQELALYNKGTRWDQNLDAVLALLALEHDYHPTFDFRRHGGLSLLLQTPWTRPEHLSVNLAVILRARLAGLCGKVLTSRLRLYPDLPLCALAARDGLLLDAYDDPLLDTARGNMYDDEVPWAFQHPGMHTISRLLLRLGRDDVEDDLAAVLHNGTRGRSIEAKVELAEELVDRVIEDRDRSARSVAQEVCSPAAPPRAAAPCPQDDLLEASPSLLAFVIGQKPVVRLEANDLAPDRADEAWLSTLAPVVRRRTSLREGQPIVELFLGRDEAMVNEAIALTDAMDAAKDDAQWRACASRVGVLLGYPSCCAEAFAAESAFLRVSYMWMYLMARLRHAGPACSLLNPGLEHLVHHVPCSLSCEATRASATGLLEAIRDRFGAKTAEELERSSQRPWLLLLDEQGAAVELAVEGSPLGRFPFQAGRVRGNHRLLRVVAAGDEIEVDDQNIVVLRRGRAIAALGGRAFLWWYQAPVQGAFLSRIAALRFDAPAPGQQADRLAAFIVALCRGDTARRHLRGFRVAAVRPQGDKEAAVSLVSGGATVNVVVALREPGRRGYVEVGPVVVFHERGHAIDTMQKDRAVRGFANLLAAALARAGRSH